MKKKTLTFTAWCKEFGRLMDERILLHVQAHGTRKADGTPKRIYPDDFQEPNTKPQ